MSVQAVMLSYGGGKGRFDAFQSNLFSIWGNERLVGNYFGPLYQAKRSVSGVLTGSAVDIYPDASGIIDTVAVLALAAGDEARVIRAYDQSGNGNDFTAVSGEEPRLCTGGLMDYNLYFNTGVGTHTTDRLTCVNNSGATSAKSYFCAKSYQGVDGVFLEYGDASRIGAVSGWQQAIQVYDTTGVTHFYIGNDSSNGYVDFASTSGGFQGTHVGAVFVPASGTPIQAWSNGSPIAGTATNAGGGPSTTDFAALKWGIGTRTIDDFLPPGIVVAFLACYESDKSADAAAISALTSTHF